MRPANRIAWAAAETGGGITESVTIHDQFQFEIKLDYPLRYDRSRTAYDLEAWLFLPLSLSVNRHTYDKRDFYNDLHAYIRLQTPRATLPELCSQRAETFERLRESARDLARNADPAALQRHAHRLRLYCCIVKSALRDYVRASADAPDAAQRATQYCECGETLTRRFRELAPPARNSEPVGAAPRGCPPLLPAHAFCDEYLSLLVETGAHQMLDILRARGQAAGDVAAALEALIRHESDWRRTHGYPSVPTPDSDNEYFLYRKGMLKKYVESVLFLATRVETEGRVAQHLVFGLAAGVAMLFAALVLFYYQTRYGNLSLPFLAAIVISYMFKDRLKELTRALFSNLMTNFLFDHKTVVYAPRGRRIGLCREAFDFVPEAKAPAEVLALRNADHLTEIENEWRGENIIRYRKRIHLRSARIHRLYAATGIDGLNDILRLHVARYLARMDDPHKPLYVCDDQGPRRISGRRVYHLNMIIRYGSDGAARLRRFRIVLSRDGIRRIQEIRAGAAGPPARRAADTEALLE